MTSWVYELPTGAGGRLRTGSKVLDHILGPWQLNGILQFASGRDYHVGVSGDLANTGNVGSNNINGGYLRANLVGDPKPSGRSPAQWLNPAAFQVPPPFTFGNLGRHVFQGDSYANLDLSIFRKFRFLEDKIPELSLSSLDVVREVSSLIP